MAKNKTPDFSGQDLGEVKHMDMSHPNFGYLGHFRKPEFMRKGHNTSAVVQLSPEKTKAFEEGFNGATGFGKAKMEEPKPVRSKLLAQTGNTSRADSSINSDLGPMSGR